MDINIEKMTDETADRSQDSISVLFFLSCRRPYRFPQSHLSAIRPMRRSRASPKSEPRAVVPVTWGDKMNQARGNNDCDINNDAIKMLGGHWQGNTKHSPCSRTPVTNIKPTKPYFKKAGKDTKHYLFTFN